MQPEWFIVGILVALLIGQQAYWSFICHKLVDKLMSRNYQEFAISSRKPEPLRSISSDDLKDPIAEENAEKANAMFGL